MLQPAPACAEVAAPPAPLRAEDQENRASPNAVNKRPMMGKLGIRKVRQPSKLRETSYTNAISGSEFGIAYL